MKRTVCFIAPFVLVSCMKATPESLLASERLIPSKKFSESVHRGDAADFSVYGLKQEEEAKAIEYAQQSASDEIARADFEAKAADVFQGDPRYLNQGFALKKSVAIPSPTFTRDGDSVGGGNVNPPPQIPRPPLLPAGSAAPYYRGQMRSNPSLWPDEAQGAYWFSDFRAFQAMDIVTILVNEASEGRKKAETDTEGKFSLLAGIANFFGYETSAWEKNNANLDAENLINAKTETKFEGEGETKRTGTLRARLAAVIMEVLPNGLLRIEGTKIISLNSEEEVMVVSGLARTRDIDAENQIDSSRLANMRIDFYGRGVVTDQQSPGWGARVFEMVWPF